jgi:DNA-binding transcriptional MerR regulator
VGDLGGWKDIMIYYEKGSKKLRISTQTLRKFVKNKQITYIQVASRRFFREEDIKLFLENNKR